MEATFKVADTITDRPTVNMSCFPVLLRSKCSVVPNDSHTLNLANFTSEIVMFGSIAYPEGISKWEFLSGMGCAGGVAAPH